MNIKSVGIGLITTIALVFASTANADKGIDKDELKALIVGKTLEGNMIKWKTTYKMYVAPSGEFSRAYGNGTDEKGEWYINKKGKLCFIINDTVCRRIKRRGDGGYNVYSGQQELKQTIEKIVEGNPYNL